MSDLNSQGDRTYHLCFRHRLWQCRGGTKRKPWSLFCGACENLNGQRWDQTGINLDGWDGVWREKHVTDGWGSRTSSELKSISTKSCLDYRHAGNRAMGQGYWTLWLAGMGWHPIAKLGFCHQQTGIQVSNWECTIKHCNLTIQNWELNMFEPAKNWSHPCKCRFHRQNRD